MNLRATRVQKRFSYIIQETVVDGRFEIRWASDQPWLNLGLSTHTECEWMLLTSLLALGARRAGVSFDEVFEDTEDTEDTDNGHANPTTA